MFRWSAITVLFLGIGVVLLNAVNKTTYQKAVATDELVFIPANDDLVAQVGENKVSFVEGNNQPKVEPPVSVTVSRPGVNQPLV
ncbi:hypothetical protein EBX93_11585, partial [bacterium]|nr:hypothetical protein [bacterium]